jgi:hypothetical protein
VVIGGDCVIAVETPSGNGDQVPRSGAGREVRMANKDRARRQGKKAPARSLKEKRAEKKAKKKAPKQGGIDSLSDE